MTNGKQDFRNMKRMIKSKISNLKLKSPIKRKEAALNKKRVS